MALKTATDVAKGPAMRVMSAVSEKVKDFAFGDKSGSTSKETALAPYKPKVTALARLPNHVEPKSPIKQYQPQFTNHFTQPDWYKNPPFDISKYKNLGGVGHGLKESGGLQHPKVENLLKQLWRPGAQLGTGSSMDALRHEKATGGMVGGKSHQQKVEGYGKNISKIQEKEKLLPTEKQFLDLTKNDIQDALK